MKILYKAVSLALLSAVLLLSSCGGERGIRGDEYTEFYNSVALKIGFSTEGQIYEEDELRGFSAFNGIFTVCFTLDREGYIDYCNISTSMEFGRTVKDEKGLHEALLWASYLAVPFYKNGTEYTEEDISKIAGMLLASFDEDVPFYHMVCRGVKNEDGFEISFLRA